MFGSPRIDTAVLAPLCRRWAILLDAGVDFRTVLAREGERSTGATLRSHTAIMADVIREGGSLADALDATEDYFPRLFRELVKIGEETGQLAEVCAQLAEHYEGRLQMAREFRSALTMPVVELCIAVVIVGFLIWLQGMLMAGAGAQGDILKIGLSGMGGLVTYGLWVAAFAAGILLVIRAIRRGSLWVRPLQRLALILPWIGGPLQTICLSRLAWTMHLTFNTGMSVRRALRLCLDGAGNAYYADLTPAVLDAIEKGETLHAAFALTNKFPADFLDMLYSAEESGRVVEAMGRLAKQYRERAIDAFRVLSKIGAFCIYLAVMGLIACVIFRIAGGYIGQLNQAAAGI